MPKASDMRDTEVVSVTLLLSRRVVEHFQAHGAGWEEVVDRALRRVAGLPPRTSRDDPDPDFVSDGNEG